MTSVVSGACMPEEAPAVVDESVKRQVVTLRAAKLSLRAIAAETGISHATVRQILRDEGVDTSEAPVRDMTERDTHVVSLYTDPERRLDIQGVSEATGLAFNTVRAILGRAGVLRDRGPEASPEAKRNRPAIPYRPDDETRAWLERYAREHGISMDAAIDNAVQQLREYLPE